jgi:hypothetical protein
MSGSIIVRSPNAGPYGPKNWLIEIHLQTDCSLQPDMLQAACIQLATDISKEYSTSCQHDPEKKYLATFIVKLNEQRQVSFTEGQGNHPVQWKQLLQQPFHEFCIRVRKRIRHMDNVHKRMAVRHTYDAAEVVVQRMGRTVKATIQFEYQLDKDEYNGVLGCVEDSMEEIARAADGDVQLHLELPIYADVLSDRDETLPINVTSDQDIGIELLAKMQDALTNVVGEAYNDMLDVGNIQARRIYGALSESEDDDDVAMPPAGEEAPSTYVNLFRYGNLCHGICPYRYLCV